jgi:hypothetical protein
MAALTDPEGCGLVHYGLLSRDQQITIMWYYIQNLRYSNASFDTITSASYVYKDASACHLRCIANRDNVLVIDICLNRASQLMNLCPKLFLSNDATVIVASISMNIRDAFAHVKSPIIMDDFIALKQKHQQQLPFHMFIDPTSYTVVVTRKCKPFEGACLLTAECTVQDRNDTTETNNMALHSHSTKDNMFNISFDRYIKPKKFLGLLDISVQEVAL